jgi:hypothetical protein
MKNFQEQIKQFFAKTDKEILDYLLQWWEMDGVSENGTIRLIGTYEKAEKPDKNGNEYGFFVNVRSPKGDILYYPFRLGQVRVWVGHRESLNKEEFLQFEVKFSRRNERNPFELSLANNAFGKPKNTFFDRLEKEKFIKDLFSKRGATPDDARTIANALSKLAGDLYTDLTERFVFELLQNADDMPNEKNEVNVKFILLQENLLFVHNGKPFDQADIRAITDIGYSTKKKDPEQTGYKGIGFKVVFRESDNVLIKSGGYSFSFDKEHPFYNQLQSSLYEGLNIDEIPWQLKPIWAENYRYSREIKECEDFMKNSPVAIAIETNFQKIKLYKSQIKALFNEPRFSLFLRKIKTIEVLGLESPILIEKQKSSKGENYFVLNDNEWIINDFEFGVTPEIREGMANDKIVPEKLKEIQKSKLSFACQIKDSKIESISPDKSFLFTYLPTNVNDYKFPFLVNADFLTTANRQSIHVKNIWNLYLFEQIGFLSFKWIREIAQNEDLKFTITNLIPIKFSNLSKEEIENNNTIPARFNNGFDKAIKETAFLPTANGALCKVSDALVDLTGLSEIISYDLFVRVVNPSKTLIDNRLEFKSKLIGLQGISIFREDELKKIFANASFQQILTPQLLLEVLKFLQEKEYNFSDIGLLQSENSQGLLMPSSLYLQTNQADKSLLTFKTVYFLHPTINDYAESNVKFKNWLTSLGVKAFEGRNFISQNILNFSNDINSKITDKTNNLNFWRFVFKYELLDSEVQKLAPYYVFNTSNVLVSNLATCYLSDFYKDSGEPSVQQIAADLGLTDFNFISSDYCQSASDKSKWRKLFYGAGLKHSQNVRIFKDKIVPFIQSGRMDANNYLKITKFVFEVFNDTQNRSSFDVNLSNFQVLSTSGYLQPISQCILSDDYTQDLRLASVLPEQVLPNQIHSVYLQQISNNRQNWKEFFLRLNPNVELTSTDIVKRKISILASNPSLVTYRNVQQVWKTVLSFKEDLLKTHKEALKKIPLLLKNNSLIVPTICYFPKEYSPNTEIEELLTGYYDYFISPIFNTISGLSYSDLKTFFKQIGVEEEIRRSNVGNSYFDVSHKEHLSKFDFAKKFWAYFQKNQSLFTINTSSTFKTYIQSNPSIPCLDNAVRTPNLVHSYRLKDLVNDSSVTCGIEFSTDLETFLGLQQRLTVSKCFQILNSIAVSNGTDDKKIRLIYDDLLYRFSNESLSSYSTVIANFKQNGKLLSNKDTFQSVTSLFYQDVSANYLPLDESEKVVKRFGDKDYWKKFEVVLKQLGIQIITVSDFSLDAQSSKYDAVELNKTLNNSIAEFAKKIDTINFQSVENQLKNKFSNLKIYYSPNLKMSCSKLNYSPIVPNYYDTSQNTIYYSGNWDSISNAKLIEYLFKAFDISESQISKDEFVSILLRNIPAKYEMPSAPPESLLPDGSTGRFGEELVYKELVAKFGESRVNWLNKGGETYKEYDFEILSRNNEILYFIDAKATTTGEVTGDTVPIYIRPSEWAFMQKCKDNYIIARVYNAKTSSAYTKYLKMGLQNLQEINL